MSLLVKGTFLVTFGCTVPGIWVFNLTRSTPIDSKWGNCVVREYVLRSMKYALETYGANTGSLFLFSG